LGDCIDRSNRQNSDHIHRFSRYMLDPLTLDQLRALVAVADAGSFSAAA
jgi:hypothetical protein